MALLSRSLKYLITYFLIFISFLSKAQVDFRPGYVIKNQQDTVRGLVFYGSNKTNDQEALFRETVKSEVIKFSPNEISGYGFDFDKEYLSFTEPDEESKKIFARIIGRGPVSLYRNNDQFYVKKDQTFIKLPIPISNEVSSGSENNQTTSNPNKDIRFITILESLVQECLFLDRNLKYSQHDILSVIEAYNSCKEFVPRKDSRPVIHLNYFLSGAYVRSSFDIDKSPLPLDFSPSNSLSVGNGVDISFPRISNKTFVSIEVWYAKNFYQAYKEKKSTISTTRQDALLDISYLKFPLGVRHNLLNAPDQSLFIKAGIYFTYTLNYSLNIIEEKETNGIIYSDLIKGGYDFKDSKGGWFSVGYDHNLFGNTRLSTEIRFERGEGFVGTAHQSYSKLSNLNFLVGLRF